MGRTFLHAEPPGDLPWALHEPSGALTPRVLAALPPPDLAPDAPCPDLRYLHRRWADAECYLLFNEGEEPLSREVTLAGSGEAHAWDASSGEIRALSGVAEEGGAVRVRLEMAPHEARFLVAGPRRTP